MRKVTLAAISVLTLVAVSSVQAGTGLALPRFVSLKSTEANVRTGPGINHPILWVLRRKQMPLEIVAESKQWRKIRDVDGDEGWVHQAMISGRRTVMTIGGKQMLYVSASDTSRPMAHVHAGVEARLLGCDSEFCQVVIDGRKGWMRRDRLWGIYPDEKF